MAEKMSANQRRLAKLLLEGVEDAQEWMDPPVAYLLAAFLARRGVLAVCAATVPPVVVVINGLADGLDTYLRRLARGGR
jgi:hypothetical protein